MHACVYHNEKKNCQPNGKHDKQLQRYFKQQQARVHKHERVCVRACVCLCLCVRAHLSLTREAKIRVEKLGQSDLVDLYYRTCTATGISWRTIESDDPFHALASWSTKGVKSSSTDVFGGAQQASFSPGRPGTFASVGSKRHKQVRQRTLEGTSSLSNGVPS